MQKNLFWTPVAAFLLGFAVSSSGSENGGADGSDHEDRQKHGAVPTSVEVGVLTLAGFEGPNPFVGDWWLSRSKFELAGPDSGLKSATAGVTTFVVSRINRVIKAAVDATKVGAAEPDVVFVDFTGQGRFSAACAVPLRRVEEPSVSFPSSIPLPPESRYEYGPQTLSVKIGDRSVPVTVRGTYRKSPMGHESMRMAVATCAEGWCMFGAKICRLRIVDNTGNLKIGDVAIASEPPSIAIWGDGIMIDTGDGSFEKDVICCYVGQPVFVDGAWYQVTISDDATKVSAKPVEVRTGRLRVNHDAWEAQFVGRERLVIVRGTAQPVFLPADSYVLTSYKELGPPDPDGRRASLRILTPWDTPDSEGRIPDDKRFEVAEDKTTDLVVGSPLRLRPLIGVGERLWVYFALRGVDAAGHEVASLDLIAAGTPQPAGLQILDSQGRVVHGEDWSEFIWVSRSWKPPVDLKGKFTARFTGLHLDPFRAAVEETKFTLE